MKLGFHGFNVAALCDPDIMATVLIAAEEAGFESAWTGEHVVLIDPQEPPSPAPPEVQVYDTVAALSYAATVTKTLKLGSGIIQLPQRNPVVLAKELSTVDVLSKGRLMFGIGVGYVEHEYNVIGVPYNERGARMNDYIEAIRTLWTEEKPVFNGPFTQISGVLQRPLPTQKPHPPIIVGGLVEASYDRAIKYGDGWYGYWLTEEQTAESIAGLKAAAERAGNPGRFDELEISLTPIGELTTDQVKRYQDMGVHRINVYEFLDEPKTAVDDAKRLIEVSSEAVARA